jgi:hypothetical protein
MNQSQLLGGLSSRWLCRAAWPSQEPRKRLRIRPCLEGLENRVTLSTTIKVGPTVVPSTTWLTVTTSSAAAPSAPC